MTMRFKKRLLKRDFPNSKILQKRQDSYILHDNVLWTRQGLHGVDEELWPRQLLYEVDKVLNKDKTIFK